MKEYLTWVSEPGPFSAWGDADTKVASAKRSTSDELLFITGFSVGTDVGASKRSPTKLCPNRSTWSELPAATSVKKHNPKQW